MIRTSSSRLQAWCLRATCCFQFDGSASSPSSCSWEVCIRRRPSCPEPPWQVISTGGSPGCTTSSSSPARPSGGARSSASRGSTSPRYVLQTRRLAGRELRIAELEEEFDRAILGSLDEQQPQVPTSDPNFRPETTLSGKAFSGIYDRAPPIRVLRRVMALGRREQWSVDSREVAIGNEKLGAGSYGSVVGGEFHGSPVAVKCRIFSRSGSAADSEAKVVSFLNETRILRRVRHPNIVLLYGACVDVVNQDMSLVFERVHGITLEHIVKKGDLHNEPLSMDDRLRAMVDLCRALRYLHSRSPPIVHGDLKACNIMAETTPGATSFHRLKLLDFGLARVLTRNALPLGGTPLWMAPEVVLHPDGPPHERADIFSLGRVAFFTLTGIVALEGTSRRTIARLIQSGSLPELPWPDAVNSTLEDCRPWVELCTEFMPRLRPSIQEVGDFFDKASGLGCTPCSRESSPATSVRTASPTRLRQEEDEAGRAATLPALPGNSQSRGGAPPRQVPDERRAVSMPYLPTKLGRPQVQEECRATSPNKKLRKAFTLDMAEEASRFIADKTTYRKAWTVGFCEPLRSVGPCEIQPASKRATAASAEEQSADGLAEATKVLPGVVNASLSIVPEG